MKKVFLLIFSMNILFRIYAQQVNPCEAIRIDPFTVNGKKEDDRSKYIRELVFSYISANEFCNVVNLENYQDIITQREINSSTNNVKEKVNKVIPPAKQLLKGDLEIIAFGDCRLKLSITDIGIGNSLSSINKLIPKSILINEEILRDSIKGYVASLMKYKNNITKYDNVALKIQVENLQKRDEERQIQVEKLQKRDEERQMQFDSVMSIIRKTSSSKLSVETQRERITKVFTDNEEIFHKYLIQKYPYGYKTFVFSNKKAFPVMNSYEKEMGLQMDWQNTEINFEQSNTIKIHFNKWANTNFSFSNIDFHTTLPQIGVSQPASPFELKYQPNLYIENLSSANKSTIVLVIGFR